MPPVPTLKPWSEISDEQKEEIIERAQTATPEMWEKILENYDIDPETTPPRKDLINPIDTNDAESHNMPPVTPEIINWGGFHPSNMHGHSETENLKDKAIVIPTEDMQQDPAYQLIKRELTIAEWQAKKKGNIDSPEGNAWLQNIPPEDKEKIEKKTEARFREDNKEQAEIYDKQEIKKTYDTRHHDPILKQFDKYAEEEIQKKQEELQKKSLSPIEFEKRSQIIREETTNKYLKEAAQRFPLKAAHYAYSAKDTDLQKVLHTNNRSTAAREYTALVEKHTPKEQSHNTLPVTKTYILLTAVKVALDKLQKIPSTLTREEINMLDKIQHNPETPISIKNFIERYKKNIPHTPPPAKPKDSPHNEEDELRKMREEEMMYYPPERAPDEQPPAPPPPPQGINTMVNLLNKLQQLAKIASKVKWFANPWVWIIIGLIILIVIIIVVILNAGNSNKSADQKQEIPGFTMTIDGPDQVQNGNLIEYSINITYTGTDKIRITNPIPNNLNCVQASQNTCNGKSDLVWNLDSLPFKQTGNTKTFDPIIVVFKPTNTNFSFDEVVVADDLTASGINDNPVPGLTLQASAEQQVANGKPITYTIKATYTGNDPTVTIFGPIPQNTTLVGQATGTSTNTNNTLSWVLNKNGSSPYTFTYTIQPNSSLNDTTLTNNIYATANGTATGGNASAKIQRLDSASQAQYHPNQWTSWSYSSCSGCAIAEVMNAYGKSVTCGDILQYESDHGYWNVDQGLLSWNSIKDTVGANNWGFTAEVGDHGQTQKSLDDLISIANQGKPIVMSIGGHILVMKGGDANNVFLVDSNPTNLTTVSKTAFTTGMSAGTPPWKWDGAYAIITPK